jgi:hypothetical protein
MTTKPRAGTPQNNGFCVSDPRSRIGRVQRDERWACIVDSRATDGISLMEPPGLALPESPIGCSSSYSGNYYNDELEGIIKRGKAGCQANNLYLCVRLIAFVRRQHPSLVAFMQRSRRSLSPCPQCIKETVTRDTSRPAMSAWKARRTMYQRIAHSRQVTSNTRMISSPADR